MTTLRIATTSGDWGTARYAIVWISAVCLFPCAVLQIYTLNTTMGAGGTNFVLPWYAASTIVLTATAGMMVFGDFERMSSTSTGIFWGPGVCTTVAGLFVLALYQAERARVHEKREKANVRSGESALSIASVAPSDCATSTCTEESQPPDEVEEVDTRCYFCGVRLPCWQKAWW